MQDFNNRSLLSEEKNGPRHADARIGKTYGDLGEPSGRCLKLKT
jgi:hypothetical protein